MKRLIYLATVSMLALLIIAPTAMAQTTMMETTMMETTMMDTTMMETTMMMEDSMMEDTMMMEETTSGTGASDLPESGGPAILLPAAALLLGAGILTFAVVRRRT